MSDFTLGETIYHKFSTRAFATGVVGAMAGSPTLEIYENDNTTPIVEGAGKLVFTQNFASINGYHLATITATSANGFEAGKSYSLMMKTGTVGGTSVVGEAIWEFTLNASAAFTRLGAPAGASVSADVAAVKVDTAAILLDTGTDGVLVSGTGISQIWAEVMTGSTTAVQAMRGFIAAILGKSSGLPTAPKYRNIADSKDVISATTDTDGNRTAVTLDLT
ncbi:MAG: hypothetical protein Q7J84_18985 [Sulfuricaulis sp.]|nr:hypothetical protein [Sulfuricaulis sp.]